MEKRERVSSEMMQETQRSSSPEPSCVSLKSDGSLHHPPDPSDEPVTSDLSDEPVTSDLSDKPVTSDLSDEPVTSDLSDKPVTSDLSDKPVTSDLSDKPVTSDLSDEPVTSDLRDDQTGDQDSPQPVNDELQRVKDRLKTSMKNKYERLFEGLNLQGNETLLNRIYTQLYIIEGERGGVNEEHEVLQMEKTARTQHSQDTPISCNDIFKASPEPGRQEKQQIKTVLTKGIAGIGKTVSVQKFILDWAEGKDHQDVDFMFVLPFRELNLIRDHPYSLHRLLLDFHPELQDLDSKMYEECKVVFIFDGLDESRIPLMFSDAQEVSDVTETSSVGVLMSKLMKGDLLPSALIWITSRPAAANQIPSEYIHRLTEIQGFIDPQKEEYFRKRISDEHQASRIISHIRRARSLHIMCHIPVFCWISSTVLQKLLEEDLSAEIPQTLTEMYIHFLLIQIHMRNQKYEERDPEKLLQSNREVIVKLAEVAFHQLMKGNVMFYEEDLNESGIDVTAASVHSGICTEIFKEESVIHQRKVYSFIHLSFQEFLAAFYVFYCYLTENKEPLELLEAKYKHDLEYDSDSENGSESDSDSEYVSESDSDSENGSDEVSLYDLLRSAVDKALKSENGQLDLFLRFLLGVSLESNQRLLQDLLTHTENSSETISRTTQHIKDTIKDQSSDLSADQSINLFLCLLEVKDQTLSREIQEFVKSDKHSEKELSPSHCSTISYMLQISEEPLDELNLKKYNTSDEGRRRLVPAVVNCRKALLVGCNPTGQDCEIVSSALQSSNSVLRELHLSNNDLHDSGVKIISDGLKSPNCQLQILRLSGCMVTEEGCGHVCSALSSTLSYLFELDLSNNDLQDSGVKIISDGLKSPNCQLQILRLSGCMVTEEGCGYVSSALSSNPSHLRELDLSNNDLQDSGVKLLSDGLKSPNCQLQILRLSGCMVTEEGCGYVSSALSSNPSHLRELDLSYNHPGESGVKLLSDKLKDPNCSLQILNVDHCGEFRITAGLHKYACDLTLDPNTAHTRLILSDENRTVTSMFESQSYPRHPERYDGVIPQVLCGESLTGRCYWEAEWSGRRAAISVSYKGISRKGRSDDSVFGWNDKSWSLFCSDNRFSVWHNNKRTVIPVVPSSSKRVGVCVDVSAGTLSFYSVSDTHTLTHLHTLNTTFTEPLYAGFGLYDYNSSVSLCDIKQHPERNNSDTHTPGFSEPKPSGLDIHPLLNCQSCVHIADSDQWLQIEPSACTDEGGSKFRVRTGPGRYECVRTRMRWVCACVVSLQYRTVDGLFLNTELERLQCNRIGPVMDVTVISGKLEEVHLPHYACLGESDPSLKDAVKVLTVRDEGVTTEPVQLTRFHAKIVQPSFSITTLILSWIMRVEEHCDLLLYMCSQDPIILHLYLFPVDDCAKKKVEETEKSFSSCIIRHPRPGRPLRMRTPHMLAVPGAAAVNPEEGITLTREIPPNFFKVNTSLENDLQMTLIREEDQKKVWTTTIKKEELKKYEQLLNSDQSRPQRDEPRLNSEADKARYFDNHWSDLIQGVTNVQIIADKLCQWELIHRETYSEITQSLTSQESMRKICDIISKHSDAVKAKFISVLQEEKLYHF
ncbi:NACHT, LRR and PYD domains-containing protein 3-like isoform X2 [Rhinichthys klamathensis goyatoka]|uniref:NACHT, LRR and PYD domains-containing protein 3-like isoform X2 n=1 Tax=Rhinichthys klamathensis goyatoka TaxID=3034132 RepID=UPI0024B4B167|nr:NACHT, LRR and PYD domains-containing protein 3-like isoform X2 [Rhinichthys klamathensis goyatoka]